MKKLTDIVSSQTDRARRGRPASSLSARRARRLALVLVALGALLAVVVSPAGAAVTHTYLPGVSKSVTEGPTNGKGEHERVKDVVRMTGDGGHMWLGEGVGAGVTRVDEFSAETGEYLKRQLIEEGGVASLTEGLAVGHSTGEEEVYVGAGKGGEYVLAVYDPLGTMQATWNGAHTANKSFSGGGAGVLDGVAVDGSESLSDPAAGDVYVSTHSNPDPQFNVVDVFDPKEAVSKGEEPTKVVGELRGTCKAPGVCSGAEVVPFAEVKRVAVSGLNGDVMVLDGRCDPLEKNASCQVDVFEPEAGMPGVYKFLFSISGTPSGGAFKASLDMAVDSNTGHIYVVETRAQVVYEFDGEGKFLGRLAGTPTGHAGALDPFKALRSMGVDPVSHKVFVSDFNEEKKEGIVDVFGPDVVIPDVEVAEPPEDVSPTGATLRGRVNPDGEGPASCEFEFGTSEAFGQRAPCTEAVAEGNALVEVKSKAVEGLSPDTVYHYRLDATNKNGTNTGECPLDCGQFRTTGPGISGESVVEVSSESARLKATIDPNKAATSYYFQYSTSSTEGCGEPGVCTELPAAPGVSLGSGEAPIAVSQHPQGLSADTVYHYRVVAFSAVRPAEPFFGPDQTFRTQLAGSALNLPDGRQWELVSPPSKQGALLSSIGLTGIVQAAASGAAITELGSRPTEAGAQGYFEAVQLISRRAAGGWSSEDVSLPHASAVGATSGEGSEYRFFSQDLSTAVVEPFGEFTSLAPCVSVPESERTPYVRHNDTSCGGRAGLFTPLVNAEDTPPGTKFGGEPVGFVGATADAAHVLLSSRVALTPPPKEAGETTLAGLYEWAAGAPVGEALKLVSILPDGKLAPGKTELGFKDTIARGAISEDGTRVAWTETNGHLYLRDMAKPKTVQVDVPQAKCVTEETCGGGEVAPVFQAPRATARTSSSPTSSALPRTPGSCPASRTCMNAKS